MDSGCPQDAVTVRLWHSDAAGVIFFSNAFVLEQESYERWLEAGGFGVRQMLDGSLAPTPVVHCEAAFVLPVRVGDRLLVRLAGVSIGDASFTLAWAMEVGGSAAISVRVTRATVDPDSGRALSLPGRLRSWLASSQRETATLT